MRATTGQQQLLLKLQELENSLKQNKNEIHELVSGQQVQELRNELRKSSEQLLSAQTRYEDFEVEISRVLTDIELVDARIRRDLDRLSNSSNAKDISGVQSELAALEARKNVLETSELELLEARDAAGFEVQEAKSLREELTAKIEAIESEVDSTLGKLQSQTSIIEQNIRATRQEIPTELLDGFDRKAKRGVPIGRLLGTECGACGLSLTASALSDVKSTPEDQLPTCVNCEAFLVR